MLVVRREVVAHRQVQARLREAERALRAALVVQRQRHLRLAVQRVAAAQARVLRLAHAVHELHLVARLQVEALRLERVRAVHVHRVQHRVALEHARHLQHRDRHAHQAEAQRAELVAHLQLARLAVHLERHLRVLLRLAHRRHLRQQLAHVLAARRVGRQHAQRLILATHGGATHDERAHGVVHVEQVLRVLHVVHRDRVRDHAHLERQHVERARHLQLVAHVHHRLLRRHQHHRLRQLHLAGHHVHRGVAHAVHQRRLRARRARRHERERVVHRDAHAREGHRLRHFIHEHRRLHARDQVHLEQQARVHELRRQAPSVAHLARDRLREGHRRLALSVHRVLRVRRLLVAVQVRRDDLEHVRLADALAEERQLLRLVHERVRGLHAEDRGVFHLQRHLGVRHERVDRVHELVAQCVGAHLREALQQHRARSHHRQHRHRILARHALVHELQLVARLHALAHQLREARAAHRQLVAARQARDVLQLHRDVRVLHELRVRGVLEAHLLLVERHVECLDEALRARRHRNLLARSRARRARRHVLQRKVRRGRARVAVQSNLADRRVQRVAAVRQELQLHQSTRELQLLLVQTHAHVVVVVAEQHLAEQHVAVRSRQHAPRVHVARRVLRRDRDLRHVEAAAQVQHDVVAVRAQAARARVGAHAAQTHRRRVLRVVEDVLHAARVQVVREVAAVVHPALSERQLRRLALARDVRRVHEEAVFVVRHHRLGHDVAQTQHRHREHTHPLRVHRVAHVRVRRDQARERDHARDAQHLRQRELVLRRVARLAARHDRDTVAHHRTLERRRRQHAVHHALQVAALDRARAEGVVQGHHVARGELVAQVQARVRRGDRHRERQARHLLHRRHERPVRAARLRRRHQQAVLRRQAVARRHHRVHVRHHDRVVLEVAHRHRERVQGEGRQREARLALELVAHLVGRRLHALQQRHEGQLLRRLQHVEHRRRLLAGLLHQLHLVAQSHGAALDAHLHAAALQQVLVLHGRHHLHRVDQRRKVRRHRAERVLHRRHGARHRELERQRRLERAVAHRERNGGALTLERHSVAILHIQALHVEHLVQTVHQRVGVALRGQHVVHVVHVQLTRSEVAVVQEAVAQEVVALAGDRRVLQVHRRRAVREHVVRGRVVVRLRQLLDQHQRVAVVHVARRAHHVVAVQEHVLVVHQVHRHRRQVQVQVLHALLRELVAHAVALGVRHRHQQLHRLQVSRQAVRRQRLRAQQVVARRQQHAVLRLLAVGLDQVLLRRVHHDELSPTKLRREGVHRQDVHRDVVDEEVRARRELPAQRQLRALRRLREDHVVLQLVVLARRQRAHARAHRVAVVVRAAAAALLHPLVRVRQARVVALEEVRLLHAQHRVQVVRRRHHVDPDRHQHVVVAHPQLVAVLVAHAHARLQRLRHVVEGHRELVVLHHRHLAHRAVAAVAPLGHQLRRIAVAHLRASRREHRRHVVHDAALQVVQRLHLGLRGDVHAPRVDRGEDAHVHVVEGRVQAAVQVEVLVLLRERQLTREAAERRREHRVLQRRALRLAEVHHVRAVHAVAAQAEHLRLAHHEQRRAAVEGKHVVHHHQVEREVVHEVLVVLAVLVAHLVRVRAEALHGTHLHRHRVARLHHLRAHRALQREHLEGVLLGARGRRRVHEHHATAALARLVAQDRELDLLGVHTADQVLVRAVKVRVHRGHHLHHRQRAHRHAVLAGHLVAHVVHVDRALRLVVLLQHREAHRRRRVHALRRRQRHAVARGDVHAVEEVAAEARHLHVLRHARHHVVRLHARRVHDVDQVVLHLEGRLLVVAVDDARLEHRGRRVRREGDVDEVRAVHVHDRRLARLVALALRREHLQHHALRVAALHLGDELDERLLPVAQRRHLQLLLHAHDGLLRGVELRVVLDGHGQHLQRVLVVALPRLLAELVAEHVRGVRLRRQLRERHCEVHRAVVVHRRRRHDVALRLRRAVAVALHVLHAVVHAHARALHLHHLAVVQERARRRRRRVQARDVLHQHVVAVLEARLLVREVVAHLQVLVVRVLREQHLRHAALQREAVLRAVRRARLLHRHVREHVRVAVAERRREAELLHLARHDRRRRARLRLRRRDVRHRDRQIREEQRVRVRVHIPVLREAVAHAVHAGALHLGRLGVERERWQPAQQRQVELEVGIELALAGAARRGEVDRLLRAVRAVQTQHLRVVRHHAVVGALLRHELQQLQHRQRVLLVAVEVLLLELEA